MALANLLYIRQPDIIVNAKLFFSTKRTNAYAKYTLRAHLRLIISAP